MTASAKERIDAGCPRDLHFRSECSGYSCGSKISWKEGALFGAKLMIELLRYDADSEEFFCHISWEQRNRKSYDWADWLQSKLDEKEGGGDA